MQQLQPNTTLQGGKYRIERVLGQGGYGITYEGLQTGLNRRVAIKEFFLKEYCEREGQTSHVTSGTTTASEIVSKCREKFIKEAQMIASFDRAPHIVRIYDIFEENGTAYYVMEYVEGGSLASLVEKLGPLPVSRAINLIRQTGQALSYLHSRQTMHLDVKPANLLLRREDDGSDNVVLIDFGISKHYDAQGHATTTSFVTYSRGFASLEQYREGGVQEFSPTSDIYSLGATLYFLLTGQTPPDAMLLVEEPLERPSAISPVLWPIISRAMSTSRRKRYQTVDEMMQALKDIKQSSSPIQKEATTPVQNEETIVARNTSTEATLIDKKKATQSYQKPAPRTNIQKPVKRIEKPFRPVNTVSEVSTSNSNRSIWIYVVVGIFIIGVIYLLVRQYNIRTQQKARIEQFAKENISLDQLAINTYMKDAEAGDSIAQRHVAYAYERREDYENAAKWWQIMANQGHPLAQRKLGKYYHDGKGVPKDLDKALYYYTKAAEQGEGTAQNNLAMMYLHGDGVEQDVNLAAKWMLKAGEGGGRQEMFNLGSFYEYGHGFKKDLNQAKYWFRKAAEKGHEEAKKKLEELSN